MAKFNAAGSIFKYGTAGGAPTNTIGQVQSGTVDFGEIAEVDTTDTSQGTNTFVPGTKAGMTMNLTVFLDDSNAGHAALIDAWKGTGGPPTEPTKISGGLTGPDGRDIYSDGYIMNISGINGAVNTGYTCTFTFKGCDTATTSA